MGVMGKPAGADGGKGIHRGIRVPRCVPELPGQSNRTMWSPFALSRNGGCVVCNAAGLIWILRVGLLLEKAVNRSEKAEAIVELNRTFKDANLVVITRQSGLTVAEVTDLRRKIRAAGASYQVAKNRLTLRALEGTAFTALGPMFKGPTAVAYSKDPVAAAKVVAAFAKSNEKLTIVGGSLGGEALDVAGVQALATLPSLDELRGKIIGLLQAPATKIAGVLVAPAGQVARVFAAYGAKEEAKAA
jgi:large subunit ribosomal protein L10